MSRVAVLINVPILMPFTASDNGRIIVVCHVNVMVEGTAPMTACLIRQEAVTDI